jgi:hypothetical protein
VLELEDAIARDAIARDGIDQVETMKSKVAVPRVPIRLRRELIEYRPADLINLAQEIIGRILNITKRPFLPARAGWCRVLEDACPKATTREAGATAVLLGIPRCGRIETGDE